MTDSPFKDGDFVRLKAGGPPMLCGGYVAPIKMGWFPAGPSPTGHPCKWFDKRDRLQEAWFQPSELVKV